MVIVLEMARHVRPFNPVLTHIFLIMGTIYGIRLGVELDQFIIVVLRSV